MKRIVVALGGNALQKAGVPATAENQLHAVQESAKHIVNMLEKGYQVILAHGNGPQVGRIVQQNELSAAATPPMPFDVCGAMSQGMIGYQIQQCLQNELRARGLRREVATVLTQVEVDPADPGFSHPTKPIGRFYSAEEVREQQAAHPDFAYKEDAGRGWRRVVSSPAPKSILELPTIEAVLARDIVPVTVGGGGIPVVIAPDGTITGVEAVIDKDLSAELLAEKLDADILLILTAVEKVCIHFGKEDQQALDRMDTAEAMGYADDGEFAPGSMLPKVLAAVRFAESKPGRVTVITSLEKAAESLEGRTGTIVVNS